MTQYERIKGLSLEELATEFNTADFCAQCEYMRSDGLCGAAYANKSMFACCEEAAKKYLESEV